MIDAIGSDKKFQSSRILITIEEAITGKARDKFR